MQIDVCPVCRKRNISLTRSNLRNPEYPFSKCNECNRKFIPSALLRRIKKPYRQPRKIEAILCGIPLGIMGIAVMLLSFLVNKPILTLLGGLLFSFWILLIAMSIALWKDILSNSKKEYDLILDAYNDIAEKQNLQ